MGRKVLVGVVAALMIATLAPGAVADQRRGSFIVVFEDSVRDPGSAAREDARRENAHLTHVYRHALKGYAATMSEAAAASIAHDPRVAWVERDGEVEASVVQNGATWGLDRIDQRGLPLSNSYSYEQTGAGVKAYVIDTGINLAHADLTGRVTSGTDTVDGDSDATDCNGHGTHVAGTIGGTTYGVAKSVNLVAVRVLNCNGSGTWSGVIAGIDWVTGDHLDGQPAVANMSLGGGGNSSVDAAVRRSIGDGITYAVAAGNGNQAGVAQDACNYSPARVTEALTVGATDKTDTKASFSNFGTCLDIFAPGVSITSSWFDSTTATRTISGTSMATPHVAGVAALHLQTTPSASPADIGTAISQNGTPNVVTSEGTGSPNLLLHVPVATPPPDPDPVPDPDPDPEPDPAPAPEPATMTVSVVAGASSKAGKTYTTTIEVTATGPNGLLAGAAVSLWVGTGSCPVNTAVASGSATTLDNGKATFTYKSKATGAHCADAVVTATGYVTGTGSSPFTVR